MVTGKQLWVCSLLALLITVSAGRVNGQQVAQDTPVGTPGTQVATQQTPAAAANTDELRKAAQNPVANLISVPIQNNNNFNIGPYERTQDVLNIQPVIPFKLTDKWIVISRWIQPIVWQPYPGAPGGDVTLGMRMQIAFLFPRLSKEQEKMLMEQKLKQMEQEQSKN